MESEKQSESPRPLAFTIDFSDGKSFSSQRHKSLVEKYQKKHKRGQSLGKIETSPITPPSVRPSSGNLPRKFSFQSEGYYSSDERMDNKRSDLVLPLKQAFVKSESTPEIELNDVSSPEVSPFSPKPSPDEFVDGTDFDFDRKSDTLSDAGTYVLDGDNYTEEQKARMSIDTMFNIEKVSVRQKTEDYINSLETFRKNDDLSKLPNKFNKNCVLSPILSPTQNLSITQEPIVTKYAKPDMDRGNIISVTASGAFRKAEPEKPKSKQFNLTKSEVQVETYVDDKLEKIKANLRATIVNVDSICKNNPVVHGSLVLGKMPLSNGRSSPTKIPSPIHTISRPRSRNSSSPLNNIDLSDSSLETESYLKPTQNFINSLQQKLSLDNSTEESDCRLKLNNAANNFLKQSKHIRHNSLDGKFCRNKLEHFHNNNKTTVIDQTFKLSNQSKIQNSPIDSPIKRSSSFSNKNPKNINNMRHSTISRSASTANIKPNPQLRRTNLQTDRNFDTESSSEEDFDRKKTNLTNTRYNRAFSLRRARLDEPIKQTVVMPDLKKNQDRSISVDRKPMKTVQVQSRYLLNITKKPESMAKIVPKSPQINNNNNSNKQIFSRTDSGRFSMKSKASLQQKPKKCNEKTKGNRSNSSLSSREMEFQNWKRRKSYDPMKAAAEGKKKEIAKRQNIMTQSCNECCGGNNNQNFDCDSSPSHSSSVHRSQSFHGTAAMEQLISSEEEFTLSADEDLSPPLNPSPCTSSPARICKNKWNFK